MATITVQIDTEELENPAVQIPRVLTVATQILDGELFAFGAIRPGEIPVLLSDEFADGYQAGTITVA